MKFNRLTSFIVLATIVSSINVLDANAFKIPSFLKHDKTNQEDTSVESVESYTNVQPAIHKVKPKVVVKENFDSLVYKKSNSLGLTHCEEKLKLISNLISDNRLSEAEKSLTPTLDWLERATEYHADLFKTLKKVEKAEYQADVEKKLALKTAVLRDEAIYQQGVLLVKQDKKREAVNNFVYIVKSQPKTNLGHSAYEKLQEIGFTYKVQFEETPEVIESL